MKLQLGSPSSCSQRTFYAGIRETLFERTAYRLSGMKSPNRKHRDSETLAVSVTDMQPMHFPCSHPPNIIQKPTASFLDQIYKSSRRQCDVSAMQSGAQGLPKVNTMAFTADMQPKTCNVGQCQLPDHAAYYQAPPEANKTAFLTGMQDSTDRW